MKVIFFTIFFAVAITAIFILPAWGTGTAVKGIIDVDTELDLAGSPYYFVGAQLAEGVTLTVKPGVTIGGGRIEFWGNINIIGTTSRP